MRTLSLALVTAAAFAVAACQSAPQADVSNSQLIVELRDYKVTPSVTTVKAGVTKIGIRNLAGMAHDLTVLKTETAEDKLAVDGGSAKVKEDGMVGKVETIPVGSVAALTVTLAPGNYVILCNVAGHYSLGMHAALKVE